MSPDDGPLIPSEILVPEKEPRFDRSLFRKKVLLTTAALVGVILNVLEFTGHIGEAIAFFTYRRAWVLSACIGFAWFLASVLAKRNGIPWIDAEKKLFMVTKLGWVTHLLFFGAIIAVWLPPVFLLFFGPSSETIPSPTAAQSKTLAGIIYYRNSSIPVPGVRLRVYSSGQIRSAQSDSQGYFNVSNVDIPSVTVIASYGGKDYPLSLNGKQKYDVIEPPMETITSAPIFVPSNQWHPEDIHPPLPTWLSMSTGVKRYHMEIIVPIPSGLTVLHFNIMALGSCHIVNAGLKQPVGNDQYQDDKYPDEKSMDWAYHVPRDAPQSRKTITIEGIVYLKAGSDGRPPDPACFQSSYWLESVRRENL